MSDPFQRSYPLARARIQHGCILAAFLTILGLVLLFLGDPAETGGPWTGGLLLAFACLVLANVYRTSRNREDRLIIDDRGVWYYEWRHPPVPWSQIADVFQRGGRVQSHLAIQLRDADAFAATFPEVERRRATAGRLAKNGLLLIPNNAVEASLGEIAQAIHEGQQHYTSGHNI